MGQKQAAYDATGAIFGFYDTEDSPAPEGVTVIDITNDQWQALLDAQASGKIMVVQDGQALAIDPPPPTADQISAMNAATRDSLLADAALSIAPLQDASDIGEATDAETAALLAWKKYRVAVNRADLTQNPAAWPDKPQA